jgi:molecular chaperone DnaJ
VTRKLSVSIPAGVSDGMRIRLNGEGEPGERGGPPGNLYVELSVKPDPVFQRLENDIVLDYPIDFVQAALGAEVEVPTLEGATRLNIPPGTQHGATFRLRNQGVPVLRSNRRGDQIVSVRVTVPQHLTPKQRQLLEEFDATLRPEEDSPQGRNTPARDTRNAFEKLLDRIGKVFG